jgi:hypothetical protein
MRLKISELFRAETKAQNLIRHVRRRRGGRGGRGRGGAEN